MRAESSSNCWAFAEPSASSCRNHFSQPSLLARCDETFGKSPARPAAGKSGAEARERKGQFNFWSPYPLIAAQQIPFAVLHCPLNEAARRHGAAQTNNRCRDTSVVGQRLHDIGRPTVVSAANCHTSPFFSCARIFYSQKIGMVRRAWRIDASSVSLWRLSTHVSGTQYLFGTAKHP